MEQYNQRDGREQENKDSAAANAAAGLPALTGSLKQIAWAETIRAKALAEDGYNAKLLAAMQPPTQLAGDKLAQYSLIYNQLRVEYDRMRGRTSATWWIDNRDILESWVYYTRNRIAREVLAEEIAATERAKQEAVERQRAEAAAKAAIEHREYQDALVRDIARASTFVVGDAPDSVQARPYRDGGDLTVKARDGREALGYIDHGEWVIYQIGGHTNLPSEHPEMERIAEEARAQFDRSFGG